MHKSLFLFLLLRLEFSLASAFGFTFPVVCRKNEGPAEFLPTANEDPASEVTNFMSLRRHVVFRTALPGSLVNLEQGTKQEEDGCKRKLESRMEKEYMAYPLTRD